MLTRAVLALTICGMIVGSAQAKPNPNFFKGSAKVTTGRGFLPGTPIALRFLQGGCTHQHLWKRVTYTNLYGITLWSYTEQVDYCTNGSVVTYFYRVRRANIPSLLPFGISFNPWSFDGNVASNCDSESCFISGDRSSSREAYTQGHFSICLAPLGIGCNNVYPWVDIYVDGSGSTSATGGV